MRKHFLLLFLMAILPLAGWAQGRALTDADVSVPSGTYAGTLNATQMAAFAPVVTDGATPLTLDTDYTWDGLYYSDSECTQVVTLRDVATYYVKVEGKAPYSGVAVASFEIQKAQLELSFKKNNAAVSYIVKKFGADDPELSEAGALDVVAVKTGDTKNGVISGLGTAGYTYTGSNANVAYNATTGTGYTISFTGVSLTTAGAKNYTIVYPTVKMLIQRININLEQGTPSKLSVIMSAAPSTYLGSNQTEPTYTITWNGTPLQKTTNGTNNDFKVTYTKGGVAVAANAIHDAGDYVATITGLNNYEGAVTSADYNFTIDPADLYVGVEDVTKVYKGAAYTDGQLGYVYYFDGLKAGDAESIVTKTAAVAENKNVGDYTITVTATSLNTNYNVHSENGKLTITPKSGLTITANKTLKLYGKDFDTANYTYKKADNTTTTDAFTVTGAVKDTGAAIDENAYATFSAAIDVTVSETNKNAGTHTGFVTLTAKDTDADTEGVQLAQVLKNYTNIQYVANDLEITPAPLRFTPKNISKTYGEADPKTWNVEAAASDFRVRGLQYEDTEAAVVSVYPKLSRESGDNAGEYVLTPSDPVVGANYEAVCETGKFIINKKVLKITAPDQTFEAGGANNSAVVAQNYTIDTTTPLVNGDAANKVFKLEFAAGVTSAMYTPALATGQENAYDGTNKKFVAVPDDEDDTEPADVYNEGWDNGIFVGGITIAAYTGSGSKADNYDFETNFTAGKVIVLGVNADRLLLDDSKNLATAIKNAAEDLTSAVRDVTFTARTLNAEKWNAMVLPFDVDMDDLITAFGEYVVVDVLKNTTDGNAHFKINLDEIPANTPFLIMTKSAKNMNTVEFDDVTISYVTAAAAAAALEADPNSTVVADQLDADGNPYVETDGGVKFVGVYNKKTFYNAPYIKYMSQGQFYTAENYTQASPLVQKPLRAYLDLSGVTNNAAPMIFIENPDGSTTAISAINSENVVDNYTKDGWYTVNGMKLNGMPIEKGVYIHNGKKVVLK